MKTLHLTLKKKWFDMILSGEKKEEYREIKKHWCKRLLCLIGLTPQFFSPGYKADRISIPPEYFMAFDTVTFTNGYAKNAPQIVVEFKGTSIGTAKPEWSDNWQGEVFIISLGEILETRNLKQ